MKILKVIWAALNVILIVAFVAPQLWIFFAAGDSHITSDTSLTGTVANSFWVIFVTGIVIYFLSWLSVIVAAVNGIILTRLIPRLKSSRWPSWLYAGILLAGLGLGIYSLFRILLG